MNKHNTLLSIFLVVVVIGVVAVGLSVWDGNTGQAIKKAAPKPAPVVPAPVPPPAPAPAPVPPPAPVLGPLCIAGENLCLAKHSGDDCFIFANGSRSKCQIANVVSGGYSCYCSPPPPAAQVAPAPAAAPQPVPAVVAPAPIPPQPAPAPAPQPAAAPAAAPSLGPLCKVMSDDRCRNRASGSLCEQNASPAKPLYCKPWPNSADQTACYCQQ